MGRHPIGARFEFGVVGKYPIGGSGDMGKNPVEMRFGPRVMGGILSESLELPAVDMVYVRKLLQWRNLVKRKG